ncbi:MAG: sensor histidine kinase [Myxococcales bacterium]|nr:sensor histidine kinase [Myxococcales bacterium]
MSISTRTALAFAFCAVLCAGATGMLLSSLSRANLEDALVGRQRLFAISAAMAFQHDLELATEELEHIARIVREEAAFRSADDSQSQRALERRVIHEAWRLTLFFDEGVVQLVDATGRCLAAEPGGCPRETFAERPWFVEARDAPGATLRFGTAPEGLHSISVTVPVRGEQGDSLGLVRGTMLLERGYFFDETSIVRGAIPPLERPDPFDPGRGRRTPSDDAPPGETEPRPATPAPSLMPRHLVLLGPGGDPLFHEGDPRLDAPAWRDALAGIARGEPDARLLELDGERLVVAWAPVGRTGAGLAYSWRWADLDRQADERARAFLLAAAIVALVGMIVGFLVARWLTQPVLSLAADVGAVRRGDAHLATSDGDDEVAVLRRAFAEVVDELASQGAVARADRDRVTELASTLEARVEERTRELEQTRDALVDAERLAALGRAGAALSHELRNSLNSLSVGMDALGAGLAPEGAKAVRQQVRAEIARLRSLSDLLLDFARPRRLSRTPLRAGALLGRALDLVEDHAREHDATLELQDRAPNQLLDVDADLLQSVLTNLLRNAIEAVSGRDERKVRVHARVYRGAWVVEVRDTGPGIEPSLRDALFQPFSSGRVGGVGLGLAVSRRFAELHGGTLEERSGSAGPGGACFRLTIPLGVEAAEDALVE